MKTIEERAGNFAHVYELQDDNGCKKSEMRKIHEIFAAGALSERRELTRWNDPKEVLPENNQCVLFKVADRLSNESVYLGSREGVEYITDGGLVFGTDFDDTSMADIDLKVIGWREIHE